jgi:F-type H+-transporting ATPase subunit a
MAAGKELTPSEYIQHHLSFFEKPLGDGGFWTLNVDSIVTAFVLGVIGLGFLWMVVRGATAGVPGKRQAFVELLVGFIDDQVKGIFHHGDRNRFVAPAALTVFVWIVLMNSMDFIPADLAGLATHGVSEHGFRIVPTADVNTTFALALSVWLLMIGFSIKAKGVCALRSESTPLAGQLPVQHGGVLVQAALAFAAAVRQYVRWRDSFPAALDVGCP